MVIINPTHFFILFLLINSHPSDNHNSGLVYPSSVKESQSSFVIKVEIKDLKLYLRKDVHYQKKSHFPDSHSLFLQNYQSKTILFFSLKSQSKTIVFYIFGFIDI